MNVFNGININEHIPSWIKNPKETSLFWTLHEKSLECLDSLDKNVIQKGKEYILQMLEIVPNHAVALYNLACAESLLGNVKESIANLERAIDAGYQDLEHMLGDADFNNIKNTEGFQFIVNKLEGILYPQKQEEKNP